MKINQSISPGNFDVPRDPVDPYLRALENQGFVVIPGFLDQDTTEELLFEMNTLSEQGSFHRAGVGAGSNHRVVAEIRSDSICWFESGNPTPLQKKYLDLLLPLRDRIAEYFRMPLSHEELFYSIYPEGGFYRKHYDNFQGESRRLLTAVLYLNQNWKEEFGGELRIHPPAPGDLLHVPHFPVDLPHLDFYPNGGSLALFLTLYIPHSVRKALRERRSIVAWFGSTPDPVRQGL